MSSPDLTRPFLWTAGCASLWASALATVRQAASEHTPADVHTEALVPRPRPAHPLKGSSQVTATCTQGNCCRPRWASGSEISNKRLQTVGSVVPTRPRAAPLSAWWGAGRRGVARSALDRDVCIARLVFTSEHTENDHEGTMCYNTSVSPGMLSGLPVIHPIHPRGSPHCLPDAQLLKVTVTTGLRRMTTARQTGCPGTLEMSPPRCLTGHLCLPAPPPSTSGPAAPLGTPARELPGRAGRQPCRLHSRPLTGSSWGTGPRPGGRRPSPSFPRRSAGPARPVPFLLLYSTTCLLSASWSIPHRLGGAAEPTASLGDGAPGASGSLGGEAQMKRQRGLEGAPGWRRPPPRCLRAGLATKGQAVAFSSPGPPRPHSRCPSGTGQPPGRSPARGRRTRCLPTRSRGAPGQVHATVGGPFGPPSRAPGRAG